MTGRRPRIGLALGSGGARGFAHIPVLEAFDDCGVTPVLVHGSSIGAVIGAAWRAGHSGAALRAHVLATVASPMALAADAAMSQGGGLRQILSHGLGAFLLDGEKLLPRVWPQPMPERFEDLRAPFAAFAADLQTGEPRALSSGPLLPAVAASMAIPGVFRPVAHEGRMLIDGVAAEPVPVAGLIARCDLVVAVELNGVAADASPQSGRDPLALAARGLSLLEHALTREKLAAAPPDLLLQPDVGQILPLDMLRAEAAIAAGEAAGARVRQWLREVGAA